jgi:hypothetical protein
LIFKQAPYPTVSSFSVHAPATGTTVVSGFTHALSEARRVTGRDEKTGAKGTPSLHGSWIGAIAYFALLDQISDCFKPKSAPLSNLKDLRRGLEHFTSLNALERDALYALRCAFTHDYSLYNIKRNKPSLTHNFQVTRGASGPVISLPKNPWDGDYRTRNSSNQTTANLEAFGDLVEDLQQDRSPASGWDQGSANTSGITGGDAGHSARRGACLFFADRAALRSS